MDVSVTQTDSKVILTVSDNGIGIPKEDHQRYLSAFIEWIRAIPKKPVELDWDSQLSNISPSSITPSCSCKAKVEKALP